MNLSQAQYDKIIKRLLLLEDPNLTHPCTRETDITMMSEAIARIEKLVTDIRLSVYGNGKEGLAESVRKNADAIEDIRSEMDLNKVHVHKINGTPPEKATNWTWFRDKVLGSLVVGVVLFLLITFIPQLMVLVAEHAK